MVGFVVEQVCVGLMADFFFENQFGAVCLFSILVWQLLLGFVDGF